MPRARGGRWTPSVGPYATSRKAAHAYWLHKRRVLRSLRGETLSGTLTRLAASPLVSTKPFVKDPCHHRVKIQRFRNRNDGCLYTLLGAESWVPIDIPA